MVTDGTDRGIERQYHGSGPAVTISAPAHPTAPPDLEGRVVLQGISWETYERLLSELDSRPIHLTYDRGSLEIMSPSREHERFKTLLGRLVEQLTLELEIPIASCGSTTWKSELLERGIEPDECYYVAHERLVRHGGDIDLATTPPPDLAVEVEISRSAVDRLGIYAALGIPEVWRWNGATLTVEVLEGGSYRQSLESPAFPELPLDVAERFLRDSRGRDETGWTREFRDWVRDRLSPRG